MGMGKIGLKGLRHKMVRVTFLGTMLKIVRAQGDLQQYKAWRFSPCISGPNATTSPVTSGSNFHVVLFQVFPMLA
jgi:hypothetical protein